jgi:hypothetical protein
MTAAAASGPTLTHIRLIEPALAFDPADIIQQHLNPLAGLAGCSTRPPPTSAWPTASAAPRPGHGFVVCYSRLFDGQGGGLEFVACDLTGEVDPANPLLDRAQMRTVLSRSLGIYADRHAGRRPSYLVVHKAFGFTEEETRARPRHGAAARTSPASASTGPHGAGSWSPPRTTPAPAAPGTRTPSTAEPSPSSTGTAPCCGLPGTPAPRR